MESIPSYIKITKLDTDTIVEKVNVGSNWIPKMQGVRLTHLPTRTDENGVEDLKKAIHYIEKLIQVEGK